MWLAGLNNDHVPCLRSGEGGPPVCQLRSEVADIQSTPNTTRLVRTGADLRMSAKPPHCLRPDYWARATPIDLNRSARAAHGHRMFYHFAAEVC